MKSFRDLEETWISVDHQPMHIDSGASAIRKRRREQLGDATTCRRGIHMPHRAAPEIFVQLSQRVSELVNLTLGQHSAKLLRRPTPKRNLLHSPRVPAPIRRQTWWSAPRPLRSSDGVHARTRHELKFCTPMTGVLGANEKLGGKHVGLSHHSRSGDHWRGCCPACSPIATRDTRRTKA